MDPVNKELQKLTIGTITNGLFMLVLAVVIRGTGYIYDVAGSGIWLGIWCIVTGIVGIRLLKANASLTPYKILSGLSIVGSLAGCLIIFLVIVVINGRKNAWCNEDWRNDENRMSNSTRIRKSTLCDIARTASILNGILVALMVMNFVVSIVALCKSNRATHGAITGQVVTAGGVVGQPDQPAVVYVNQPVAYTPYPSQQQPQMVQYPTQQPQQQTQMMQYSPQQPQQQTQMMQYSPQQPLQQGAYPQQPQMIQSPYPAQPQMMQAPPYTPQSVQGFGPTQNLAAPYPAQPVEPPPAYAGKQ